MVKNNNSEHDRKIRDLEKGFKKTETEMIKLHSKKNENIRSGE